MVIAVNVMCPLTHLWGARIACLSSLSSKCRSRAWNRVKDTHNSRALLRSAQPPSLRPSSHILLHLSSWTQNIQHIHGKTLRVPSLTCSCPAVLILQEPTESWVPSTPCTWIASPFQVPCRGSAGCWNRGDMCTFSARAQERRHGFLALTLARWP